MRSSNITEAPPAARLVPTGGFAIFAATSSLLGSPTLASTLTIPGTGRLEQTPFVVRAAGIVTAAADTDFGIGLQFGSSLNPGQNTAIATTGNLGMVAGQTWNWWIEAMLMYNSVSGALTGTWKALINTVLLAESGLQAFPGGLNDKNEPVGSFVSGVLLATPNAGSFALRSRFDLEA